VDALEFTPSYMLDQSECKMVDRTMREFHHLAMVNDTETLGQAKLWLGEDPDGWVAEGAEWIALSEADGDYHDWEQSLCEDLYRAPNQPRGDTRGRARVSGGSKSRRSRH